MTHKIFFFHHPCRHHLELFTTRKNGFQEQTGKVSDSFSYSFLSLQERKKDTFRNVLPWSGDRDEKGGRSARSRTCADSVLVSTRPDSPFKYLRMFFQSHSAFTEEEKETRKEEDQEKN